MIIPMLCVTIFVILVVWFLLPRVARLMIHTPTAISIFVCLSMVQLMAVFISMRCTLCFFFNDTATTEIYTLSLHDALPISLPKGRSRRSYLPGPELALKRARKLLRGPPQQELRNPQRSEEHTSELQSRLHLVCRLLLEKKKISMVQLIALIISIQCTLSRHC